MELKGNDNQDIITPRATAAAIDGTAFRDINPTNAIPEAWEDRAKKAWKYYTEEPLVKNCINSWLAFALGNRIEVGSSDENLNKEARAVAERLDLTRFIKDLFLQLFVKGDGVGFKRADTENTADLVELISVNPVSIKVKYVDGNLTKVVQVSNQPGSDSLNLPVSQTIHLKWDAPNYADRGNSMVLPAFESIELLRAYRKAERAIAARWTTPFRLVKVGGNYNGKLLMPDQTQLDEVREMLSKMDMKAGLVVPFHVTAETHGNDGHVLDLENKIRSVKEDIMVAMGLSRALVTGDGPNFATASISLKKMMVMIKELKNTAIGVLKWVFGILVFCQKAFSKRIHSQ